MKIDSLVASLYSILMQMFFLFYELNTLHYINQFNIAMESITALHCESCSALGQGPLGGGYGWFCSPEEN